MSKDNATCPACGSRDTHRHETIGTAYVTIGPAFTYADVYYLCNSCKEEIDIFNETDQNYQAGQKEAQKKFVQQAIEYLSSNGVGMALFERVFELPTRTLARWKEGNFSSSALSLLHIVITFPWIIKIAEKKFSPELINKGLNIRLKNMARNKDFFQKSWEEYCEHTGKSLPEDIDELRELSLKEDCKIELNPNYSLLVIQKLGFEFSILLPTMKWIIYKAPHDENFITGDNPVVIESGEFNIFNPSFLSIPNTKIFIPVSKNVGLLMTREAKGTIDTDCIIDDKNIANKMNNSLFSNAKKYIYASEKNIKIEELSK